jgi:histidyl-tRNA synthetase
VSNPIQAIRGMNDILPAETRVWQQVETLLCTVLYGYGYQEIRLPIVEKIELFKRTIGEATDIVEKEMYTFADRNDEMLTLRPEGTAGCVRAGVEHGLLYNQIQKFWYQGPYFRYERPQKGRYRQFHQCGAEAFGIATPDIDAELILMSARIFEKLGLSAHVNLQINSLGSNAARVEYRKQLVEYFNQHHDLLDEDSKRRLSTNPLRILDSKNPALVELIQNAPKLTEHLDAESNEHFLQLQQYLKSAGQAFTINPCLVRGLDYYTKTVFEWVTTELGAQGTVCAGGRYDGLVEQLGGKATPALGFAIGMERLILMMQTVAATTETESTDIYLLSDSPVTFAKGLALAAELRDAFPHLQIIQHSGGGALKNQFKKADKSGARFAIIIGEQELAADVVAIKFLRDNVPQENVNMNGVVDFFSSRLG